MHKKLVFTLVVLLNSSTAIAVVWFIEPWQTSSPASHIAILNFESSGMVYDPHTNKLFLVDDEGDLVSSYFSQPADLERVSLGEDLEAVTTTNDGYIYVGVEGKKSSCFIGICLSNKKPKIIELHASNMATTGRSWKLRDLPINSGGMEGLTWVPNGSHPYGSPYSGGVFYASTQKNGKIYVFHVDRSNTNVEPVLLSSGYMPLQGQTDISDLYFDVSQQILYVLYDNANRLVELDISTSVPTVISNLRLPSLPFDQEGITLMPSCNATGTTTIYLASDKPNQGYYSFLGFHGVCSTDTYRARVVSQSLPSQMLSGQSYPVSVTIQNTGSTTWTGYSYQLAPTMGMSNIVSYLGASESVAPNQTKTFNLTITAPSDPENAYFQWRMKKGSKWFGSPTAEKKIPLYDSNLIPPECNPDCVIDF